MLIPCPPPLTTQVTVPPFRIVTSSGVTTLTGGVCGCGAPKFTTASWTAAGGSSFVPAGWASATAHGRTAAKRTIDRRVFMLGLLSHAWKVRKPLGYGWTRGSARRFARGLPPHHLRERAIAY